MGNVKNMEEVAVNSLRPYERNAKLHPRDQIEKLKRSIGEFGFLSPCLIDRLGNIIAGHGRVEAAKELGLETVPCVYVEGLTDEQRRAYILADNRLTELGGWDMSLVEEELDALTEAGIDATITGFDWDAAANIEPVEDDYDPEEETEDAPEPIAKRGDVWRLGNHRLMCGDSTSLEDVKKLMDGDKADMVFTDPPWNVNYGADDNDGHYKPRTILNDFMGTEEFKEFMFLAFKSMSEASKDGACTYVVMSAQEWGNMMLTLAQNGYHWSSTIIWNKDRLVLSRKDYHTKYEPIWYGWKEGSRLHPLEDRTQSDVWDFERPTRSELHPTMKPIALVARAIKNSSAEREIILDIFGGSGTTMIAAEQLNRCCYMMELDPHYCDVIIDRWEEFTGCKAEKVN